MRRNRPLISVIMPCYNAEQYIASSILSFLENTISKKCELVVVNDGSTDSTGEKIRDMISRYPENRIVYVEIPNSGVSAARNRGIREARGEYVSFLDSDDMYGRYYLETLLGGIRKYRADSCLCFWTASVKKMTRKKAAVKPIGKREVMDLILYRKKHVAVWSMLFRREILMNNRILFPEDIKYGEDIAFIWQYLLEAESFAITEGRYYYYRPAPGSAMHKVTWEKTEILDVSDQIYALMKEKDPEYAEKFESYMISRKVIALQRDYARSGAEEFYQKLKEQRGTKDVLPAVKNGKPAVRLAALAYYLSPDLFYRVFHTFSKTQTLP